MNTKDDVGFYRAISDNRYCYLILSDNVVLEPHSFLGYIVINKIHMKFLRGVLV